MIEYRKIWANARYEIITLLRGWFFRIFAGLSIVLFVALNIIWFSGAVPFVPRIFYGFSAAIPYANMILLNMIQIAVIIFMASDFFKRDRKFSTAEVYYIRSMTNANYLLGKAMGVFILFMILNILILIIALVIHLIFNDTSFNYIPYILYPVLLSFPSFVFIIGLSFLSMQLLKNQAIVVLLLLGYYAGSLFFLYDVFYYIFDFVGFKIPFAYSDFVGLANFKLVLLQRGLYFSLGIVCILISILLFPRLSQSRRLKQIIIGNLVVFSFISIYSAISYLDFYSSRNQLRSRMIELNNRYSDKKDLTPVSCKIDFYHWGNSYRATTSYIFKNLTDSDMDHYLFSINPGLQVEIVKQNNTNLQFTQEDHIINIKPGNSLQPGLIDSIQITYSGNINEAACYLDVEDYENQNSFGLWLFQSARKHAFLNDNYVLLAPESMWYPRPGLPPGTNFLNRINRHFIDYELEVHSKPNMIPLSQGNREEITQGHFKFNPEYPLSDLTLIVGEYVEKSIMVDSINYELYHLSDHNYYEDYFTEIGDTLSDVIREFVQDYEVRLNLEYPFKRLSLIEVPIQYYVYPRIWTIAQDVVVPEQIWFQENGASIRGADFGQLKRSMDWRLDRSNQTITEKETQLTILKTFLNSTLGGQSSSGMRFGGPMAEYMPNYNLFPNYYTYVTYLEGSEWPILNSALEAFLSDRVHESIEDMPRWRMGGITDPEKVSQALSKKSLADYLTSIEDKEILPELIKQKGAFLIKLLQNELGLEAFNSYLSTTIKNSRFEQLKYNDFFSNLSLRPDFDIESYLSSWYYDKILPAYVVRDIEFHKVYDGDRIRTQVKFKTFNTESTDGLLEVSFRYSRRGRGFDMANANENLETNIYRINGNQNKQVGLLLDDEPRALNINFLLARNLPLVYTTRFEKAELEENKTPFEGEKIIYEKAVLTSPDEIIIDNDEEGFEIYNPPYNSLLKRWIHSGEEQEDENEFEPLWWWNPPHQWRPIKSATYFGTYVHSAYYTRPGDGSKYVSWNAKIKTSGIYDVYVYMFNTDEFRRRRERNDMFGDFNYQVHHDGGVEKVAFSIDGAPPGWNFLGSWYFSEGVAKVVLTNESSARFVIADAVKWVKN
jgi:hypothetical protein